MPFAGAITVSIQAENEEQVKQKFYDVVDGIDFDWNKLSEIGADIEWEFYEKMTEGNIRHFQYNELDISEEE